MKSSLATNLENREASIASLFLYPPRLGRGNPTLAIHILVVFWLSSSIGVFVVFWLDLIFYEQTDEEATFGERLRNNVRRIRGSSFLPLEIAFIDAGFRKAEDFGYRTKLHVTLRRTPSCNFRRTKLALKFLAAPGW